MASSTTIIVHDAPAWLTAVTSVGSAVVGAVFGTLGTIFVTNRQFTADTERRKLERSQEAAAALIPMIQLLTNQIATAIANGSPPAVAEATRHFIAESNGLRPHITDREVEQWVSDHARFAMQLGEFSVTPSVPDQGLYNAFSRSEMVVLQILSAHAAGGEFLRSARLPLGDQDALRQWIPWKDDAPD